MSERMTSEPAYGTREYFLDAHGHDLASALDDTIAYAIRASQTPPHAVTREQIAKTLYDHHNRGCSNVWRWEDSGLDDEHPGERERYYGQADAIMPLFEKPAPTPTPLTEEYLRPILADIRFATIGFVRHSDETMGLRNDVINVIIERLSASPTAPNTAQENER